MPTLEKWIEVRYSEPNKMWIVYLWNKEAGKEPVLVTHEWCKSGVEVGEAVMDLL